MVKKTDYADETHEETSRRWAREHIERSPDVTFTEKFRRFAYGDTPYAGKVYNATLDVSTGELISSSLDDAKLEQELREQFT